MLTFKDFAPKITDRGGVFRGAKYESLNEVLAEANSWIEQEGVKVVNVETVVLPNIWEPSEEGTQDAELHTAHGYGNWNQFIRVWYEK